MTDAERKAVADAIVQIDRMVADMRTAVVWARNNADDPAAVHVILADIGSMLREAEIRRDMAMAMVLGLLTVPPMSKAYPSSATALSTLATDEDVEISVAVSVAEIRLLAGAIRTQHARNVAAAWDAPSDWLHAEKRATELLAIADSEIQRVGDSR